MLIRAFVFFAGAALALSSIACSSLTRPDEIQIFAEPPPAPKAAAKALPPPGPGAAKALAPPAAPAAPTGCGD